MFQHVYPKASGGLVATMGLTAFLGWFAHATALIQLVHGQPAIACNTAFGFILCGLALALLDTKVSTVSFVLGGFAAALGFFTLTEYLAGLDFGIDQIFLQPYIQIGTAFPGRMAPLTAVCFLATGSSLVMGQRWRRAAGFTTVAVLMVVVAMIGCVTLGGYLAGVDEATGWGWYSRMAPNTAAGFLLFSTGLLVRTRRLAREEEVHVSRWLPVVASVTLLIMIVSVSTAGFTAFEASEALRQQTYEVLGQTQSLQDDLVGLQQGLRGFVLTGQAADRQAYQARVEDARRQIAQARTLAGDNPGRRRRLNALDEDLDAVAASAGKLIAARQAKGGPAAVQLDATGAGLAEADRLMTDLHALAEAERQTLIERSTQAAGDFRTIKRLLAAASIGAGLMLLLANVLAGRAVARQRELAERALAAERAKGDFLAVMSHEIRTPLNGVVGMTSILADLELPELARECVRTVKTSGESLLMVINDVLDFSKIESGKLRLESRPFHLGQCVEEALELFAAQFRAKKLEAVYLVAPEVPPNLQGDAMRLRQVLMNLIGNAIKFTAKGEITVNVECTRRDEHGCELLFSVRDTGVGMTAAERERLFQAFEQADSSTSRRYGGTGLGLVISKRLVELMGGKIWVESEPDRGSVFYFSLTLKPVAEHPPAEARVMAPLAALIVDDNATNRRILVIQLKMWGLRPVAVAGGAEALRILAERKFDVVLIDYQMPVMDGVALGRQIRRQMPVPLILLSSFGDPVEGEDARLFNVQIPKPIRHVDLLNALLRITGIESGGRSESVTAGAGRSLAADHPLLILLAEDNLVNQRVCLLMLARFGYVADLAETGRQAVTAAEHRLYDLILMDIQMPDMTGSEAARLIRKDFGKDCPVIAAVTAEAMAGDREKFLSQGFDAYVSKPLEVATVEELLQTVIAGKYPGRRNADPGPVAVADQPAVSAAPVVPAVASAAPLPVPDMDALRQLVDNEGELAELVELFATSATASMTEMRRALGSANASELCRAAHALKGSCGSFGAHSLHQLCARIELAGREGDLAEAGVAVRRAEQELAAFLESLRPYRANRPAVPVE